MTRFFIVAFTMLWMPLAFTQDTTLEEIVVTSSFTHQVEGQNAHAVEVISGDNITQNLSQSLGEHLSTTLGVSANNFGAAVGQPVIRGMSGNRVKILQNNLVVRDVSGIGPDHPIDLDLGNVQQIEVVRGAAALLHSNGASGGIINIVDNTIARTDIEEPSVTLSAEQQTGNSGEGFSAGLKQNIAGFNFSYSFNGFDAQDYEIPSGAVLHDEGDDEHDTAEEHDEHDDEMRTLSNSDYKTKAHRFGLSKTGDWGYVGASYQDLSYTYGIPFHGGGHGGHLEDHEGEEHEGEDHDDDHEGEDHEGEEGHDEHEGERIFSETDSEVMTLEGQLNVNSPLLNSIQFSVRDTDYALFEQHAEEAHEEDEHEDEGEHEDHSEEPTLFTNDSTEVQMVFNLGSADQPRRLVMNQVTEKVAVIGEEAFMEPVKSTETTLGAFAGLNTAGFDIDIGLRWDDVERKGTIREMHQDDEHEGEEEHDDEAHEGEEEHHDEHASFELEPFTFKDQSLSGAVTIGRELTDFLTASLNVAVVNRTPSAMELFMNGEHLAVARYEVGDANLDMERSNNLDFNLLYDDDTWFARASIYRNNVDNYVYLRDETEEEHVEHEAGGDEDHGEEIHEHGDLLLAEYAQGDATFNGYEIEIGRRFTLAGGELEVRIQRDQVKADFSAGGNVPRITPSRNAFAVDYQRGLSRAMVEMQDVASQNMISSFETPTSGYRLVNARLSHSIDLGQGAVLTVSAFGRNLTDEVARSHSSFVKNEVPFAGRNVGVKASVSF